MAIPTLFSPVSVGPEYAAIELGGGHLVFNNPARELLKETQKVYGDERRLSIIMSLGSGRARMLSLDESSVQTSGIRGLLKRLTVNSAVTEKDLAHQLYEVGAYIRLNPIHSYEDIRLDEWRNLSVILAHTKDYLVTPSITKLVDHSVFGLVEKRGVMSLNQLSVSFLLFSCGYSFTLSLFQARTTRIKRQAKTPPAVSPYFVVRKDGWDNMEEKLLGPHLEGVNVFVISGMGGCGKTQMVSYFVQKHHTRQVSF
jgi:hypothetical protein